MFRANDAWTASISQGGMTIDSAFRSAGIETVKTQAGTFQAIKQVVAECVFIRRGKIAAKSLLPCGALGGIAQNVA